MELRFAFFRYSRVTSVFAIGLPKSSMSLAVMLRASPVSTVSGALIEMLVRANTFVREFTVKELL